MKFLVGLPGWLAKRGIASLIIDQPGTGEALRLHGLTARFDSEHWASRVVDWLEAQDFVDPKRIGMEGVFSVATTVRVLLPSSPVSPAGRLGRQSRLARRPKKRLAREGNFPVPHYWSHVMWVWGAKDMDDFMQIAEKVHLHGILDRIRVPFLVTHGEKDSQIPLQWAHATYDQLVNSPKRELKIFDERTVAACSIRVSTIPPMPAPISPTGWQRCWAAGSLKPDRLEQEGTGFFVGSGE